MNEIYSKDIGVFGSMYQVPDKMKKIAEALPKEEIINVRLSREPRNCYIDMKNGDRYIGVTPTQGARGYRWKQVYVHYDVDLDILHTVILPKIISNLPEHEQVIGYWINES